ncbi:MAG: hypothetical protein RM021_032855 [Nostoc sp. EkiNYC01]|nr:hypothetical protein [Nostoc sp. EkiNYC01]
MLCPYRVVYLPENSCNSPTTSFIYGVSLLFSGSPLDARTSLQWWNLLMSRKMFAHEATGDEKPARAVILLLYKDVKTDPAKGLPVFTISLSENIALCALSP